MPHISRARLTLLGLLLAAPLIHPSAAWARAGTAADQISPDPHLLSDILPRHRWAVRFEARYERSRDALSQYGERRAPYSEINGLALDDDTLPLLAAAGPDASLGTIASRSEIAGVYQRLTVEYGFSDDITAGVILPWGQMSNRMEFATRGANLETNPLFDPALPISDLNSPFVPLGTFTGTPATTEDAQRVLTDPAYGYAYRRVQGFTTDGLLDPTVSVRWRIARSVLSSTILAPAVRIGMTEANDPHNLVDARLDDGSTDLLLGIEHLRRFTAAWDMRLSARYTRQLPDQRRMRAQAEGEVLVPRARTEKMDRNLGDIVEASVEGGCNLGNWRLMSRVDYAFQQAAGYTSPSGQDISGLETDNPSIAWNYWLGASWTGLRAYRARLLPIPVIAALQYRGTLMGENTTVSDNIYFTLTTVF